MSTVPGFPNATSPTPHTGLLWLTEGSGAARDKKVTALDLVADILPGAIGTGAAPDTLVGTETVPLVQTTLREAPLSAIREYMLPGYTEVDLEDVLTSNAIYAGLAASDLTVAAPKSQMFQVFLDGHYTFVDYLLAFQKYSTNPFNAYQVSVDMVHGNAFAARNFPLLVPCSMYKADSGNALLSLTDCYAELGPAYLRFWKTDGAALLWSDALGGASVEYAVFRVASSVIGP